MSARAGEEDRSWPLGSLLECTDHSDFPICLANEMMTYGGNMNSFDEASFFNAVKWVGGRCECIREAPVASCRVVISAAPFVLPKPPGARVA